MMVEVLADLPRYEPIPQPEDGVSYAAKISKVEARIDWSRPASELKRHVQGLAPFPGAWFEMSGERVKVLAAENARGHGKPGEVLDDHLTIACGNDALRPTLVQRAGKGVMSAEELLRGFAIPAGTILQ
jgi:methionyl-tRNA formyltransferase